MLNARFCAGLCKDVVRVRLGIERIRPFEEVLGGAAGHLSVMQSFQS